MTDQELIRLSLQGIKIMPLKIAGQGHHRRRSVCAVRRRIQRARSSASRKLGE